MAFSYFALLFLDPGLYPRAKKKTTLYIAPKDMEVLSLAAGFLDKSGVFEKEKLLSSWALKRMLSKSIDAAIKALKLPPADRTAHKKRIMRKLSVLTEQRVLGQK
jgi:hypothetical protein